MKRSGLIAAAFLSVLHGCTKTPEAVPSVSWYLEHPTERQAKVSWCADDMQRKETPDCRNALEAHQRLGLGRMKDAPPLDWNKPDAKPQ